MTTKNLNRAKAALNELVLDAALSDTEAVLLRQRIDLSLASPSPWAVSRAGLAVAMASAAIATAVAGTVWLRPEPRAPGWYELRSGLAGAEPGLASVAATTDCAAAVELGVGPDAVQLSPGAVLTNRDAVLSLTRGQASFAVTKRAAGEAPFTLEVSAGRIVVLGTRFTVRQGTQEGELRLDEGRVNFEWADGDHTEMTAGETLRWPRAADDPAGDEIPEATAPRERPPMARPSTPTPPTTDLADMHAILERLAQLRGQRRYAEAIELLSTTKGRADFTLVQRARLAFELGLMLERQGVTRNACEHWRDFIETFPHDSFASEAAAKLRGCSDDE